MGASLITGEEKKSWIVPKVTCSNGDPTIAVFINHNRFPESGLIGITAHNIEIFSWGSGEKLHEHYSEYKILAADCNLESDLGGIIVYANDSGKVHVLDCDEL